MTQQELNPAFESLLTHIKENRGFDFTGYKRSSLMRRIDKRMETVGIESYVDYKDYLEVHPDEFAELFNTILINVTAFFRDPAMWDYLRETVVPEIVSRKGAHETIRLWSAACASGNRSRKRGRASASVWMPLWSWKRPKKRRYSFPRSSRS